MRDYDDDDDYGAKSRFTPGNAAGNITNFFDKIPRWAKITVASLMGLFVIAIVCIMFSGMFYFQTKAGYSYYYQNTLLGTEDAFFTPDVHFKIPIFSSIEEYKQVVTVSYGDNTKEQVLAAFKRGILFQPIWLGYYLLIHIQQIFQEHSDLNYQLIDYYL